MFSHEVQLGAIELVAQSVEGLNSELFRIMVAFATFLVLVFAAEYINKKLQARRLNAFAEDKETVREDNMISNSNTKTAIRDLNLFDIMRSFGYGVVNALVAIPELSWIVGKELTIQSASFGWFAIKGLLAGVKLVAMIAMFCLVMGLVIPVVMIVGMAIAAKDMAVSGYRKVTGWVAAKKAARAEAKAAAKAKAEAEAKAEFKKQAEAAGFVAAEEVAGMVNLAVEKAFAAHEQRKVNLANIVAVSMPEISLHAKAVVLKSVEDMTRAEMREELGLKGFNTKQLQYKVRAARAAANS